MSARTNITLFLEFWSGLSRAPELEAGHWCCARREAGLTLSGRTTPERKVPPVKKPKYSTLREFLFWSYANLGMAHAALDKGMAKYNQLSFMIRAKLYKGLCSGTISIRTLLDDEKLKIQQAASCSYCGLTTTLTMDHLLPRYADGPESADNVVWVCKSCNSSKGKRDFLVWWPTKFGTFPPLLLLRRYLKLAVIISEELGVADQPLGRVENLPFDVKAIPTTYPPPAECVLWVSA